MDHDNITDIATYLVRFGLELGGFVALLASVLNSLGPRSNRSTACWPLLVRRLVWSIQLSLWENLAVGSRNSRNPGTVLLAI